MAARRGVGLGAFSSRNDSATAYRAAGDSLKSANKASQQTQMEVVQGLLHTFAIEHTDAIKSNPNFRAEFAKMCRAVGVDPLAGTNLKGKEVKGLRAKVFGANSNDFYCSVAVRVVELCQRTRAENGGLIGLKECRDSVAKGREIGGGIQVSEEDVVNAVKILEPLRSGFCTIEIAGRLFIRSVPKQFNVDQSTVLEVLYLLGNVTVSLLRVNLKWDKTRAQSVLDDLMADSLVWIDTQCPEPEYWLPQNLLDDD